MVTTIISLSLLICSTGTHTICFCGKYNVQAVPSAMETGSGNSKNIRKPTQGVRKWARQLFKVIHVRIFTIIFIHWIPTTTFHHNRLIECVYLMIHKCDDCLIPGLTSECVHSMVSNESIFKGTPKSNSLMTTYWCHQFTMRVKCDTDITVTRWNTVSRMWGRLTYLLVIKPKLHFEQ